MPVQIGAKVHSFSDPTGLLYDCHRRIEMFLGSLQRVAEVIDRPLTDEARAALESALRYFRESAPKHTADEEESLFPRLRQIQDPEIENALGSLDALEADHHKANTLHGEVDVLGTRCLNERCLPGTEAAKFRLAVNNLASIYGEHIRIEDEVVFPTARRKLSSPQQSAIANEMASCRNLSSVWVWRLSRCEWALACCLKRCLVFRKSDSTHRWRCLQSWSRCSLASFVDWLRLSPPCGRASTRRLRKGGRTVGGGHAWLRNALVAGEIANARAP